MVTAFDRRLPAKGREIARLAPGDIVDMSRTNASRIKSATCNKVDLELLRRSTARAVARRPLETGVGFAGTVGTLITVREAFPLSHADGWRGREVLASMSPQGDCPHCPLGRCSMRMRSTSWEWLWTLGDGIASSRPHARRSASRPGG